MKIKLNLLSANRKEIIEESKKIRVILKWGIEIFGILLIFLVLLLNIKYILKTEIGFNSNNFQNSELDSKYAEIESYSSEIKQINSKMTEIENIQREQLYWSELFSKLNELLTPEIALSGLSNKDFVISLTGKSKTREALVSLKDRLERENCFSDVNLPLSNLVSKDDATFQIDFNIKEECLK